LQNFFTNKNALIIGQLGKRCVKLLSALFSFGARPYCFALPHYENKDLKGVISLLGDIRNKNSLEIALQASAPEFIFHFFTNYPNKNAAEIFETNIMGIVNLLELSQNLEHLRKIIILSDNSDINEETGDVYEASKNAAVIVAKTYEAVLKEHGITLLFKNFEEIDKTLSSL